MLDATEEKCSFYTNAYGHKLTRLPGSRRLVPVHRLVVELAIGRQLQPYEIIHHRDGNKQYNHFSNLEMVTDPQHKVRHGGGRTTTICPACRASFSHPKAKQRTFCSNSCRAQAYAEGYQREMAS